MRRNIPTDLGFLSIIELAIKFLRILFESTIAFIILFGISLKFALICFVSFGKQYPP